MKLSVLVSAAGKVMNVKVTKSSGSAALDNAGKRGGAVGKLSAQEN